LLRGDVLLVGQVARISARRAYVCHGKVRRRVRLERDEAAHSAATLEGHEHAPYEVALAPELPAPLDLPELVHYGQQAATSSPPHGPAHRPCADRRAWGRSGRAAGIILSTQKSCT